jgi:hypothetical protein
MSDDWRDFPDEPGFWWRLTLRYADDGYHGIRGLSVVQICEVVGDLACTSSHDGSAAQQVAARRPDPTWREKQSVDAQQGWYPGQNFHPYRWLKIVEPDLGRDEHGRISHEIVWGKPA